MQADDPVGRRPERPDFWRRHHSKGVWIAVGFMIGSTFFALGSFPPYFDAFSEHTVAITFFVGSIFFTAAALGQVTDAVKVRAAHRGTRPTTWRAWTWEVEPLDFGAATVQFVGTLFFNLSTGFAINDAVSTEATNRLVWAPDMFGSAAFLVSSYFAEVAITRRPWQWRAVGRPAWIAKLNLIGSIAFGVSAIAALTLPTTGEMVSITLVNGGTFVGAVCFFVGAALMLPEVRNVGRVGIEPTTDGL